MKIETPTIGPTQNSILRTIIIFFPALIGFSVAWRDLRITLALAAVHLGLITYFMRLNRRNIRIQILLVLAIFVTLGGTFFIGSSLH